MKTGETPPPIKDIISNRIRRAPRDFVHAALGVDKVAVQVWNDNELCFVSLGSTEFSRQLQVLNSRFGSACPFVALSPFTFAFTEYRRPDMHQIMRVGRGERKFREPPVVVKPGQFGIYKDVIFHGAFTSGRIPDLDVECVFYAAFQGVPDWFFVASGLDACLARLLAPYVKRIPE